MDPRSTQRMYYSDFIEGLHTCSRQFGQNVAVRASGLCRILSPPPIRAKCGVIMRRCIIDGTRCPREMMKCDAVLELTYRTVAIDETPRESDCS